MPYCLIQPHDHIPFRNPLDVLDDPFGDFTSGQVRGMNQDYQEEQRFWREEHQ